MKILVVEDEPTSLKLATLVLTTEGHEVSQSTNATDAIRKIVEKNPEMILLDLRLPGVDGLQLARQLKNDRRTQDISIVAVTAYPLQFSIDDAFQAGCDGYIVKPIDTRKLSSELESVSRKSE